MEKERKTIKLKHLEKPTGTLTILLCLYGEESLTLSELKAKGGLNLSVLYNSIAKLEEMEIVSEEKREKFPFIRRFRLTNKGRKVAKHLLEIEKILQDASQT